MQHGNTAMTRLWHLTLAIIVIAGLFVTVGPRQASASGIVGRGTPESCSEAALNAALIGGGLVTFNCGSNPTTITVTSEKVITRNTRVVGGNLVAISGGDTTRIFRVDADVTFGLETILITNGYAKDAPGGAILNNGTMTTNQVTVTDSRIEGRSDGAGVFNSGTVTLNSTLFLRNSGDDSGGLANVGVATVNGSIFRDNSGSWGGAIVNRNILTINGSTIVDNRADYGYGAGLYVNGGTTTVNDSFFGRNNAHAGGGIFANGGTVDLNRVTLTGNTADAGAGVYSEWGRINVDSSTFIENVSRNSGGAISIGGNWSGSSGGSFGIINSTFSGNRANYGGAIATYGESQSTISYSTIFGNDAQIAGGGFYQEYGTTKMTGVVLGSNGGNCTGIDPVSDGHNLSSDPSCGFTQLSDKLSTDPLLFPLADNGGPTKTHHPATGSPLIDAGAATCAETDQRGATRPNGAACDIGAVEGEAPADTTAPEATVPVETFFKRRGSISETGVQIGLAWSATDVGYGVERFELERSTNGGAWTAVTLKDATTATHSMTLAFGKSYRFRVRAIDRAGNVGNWAEAASFDIERYEETTPSVRYKGTWTQYTSSTTWGGTTTYSKTAYDTASFTFSGTSVAWVSAVGASRGKATVYVDNVFNSTVDLYATTSSSRNVVWKIDGLTEGQHTIRIRVNGTKNTQSTGTRVDVTGFIVLD